MKLSAALHCAMRRTDLSKPYRPCPSQPLIKPHRPAEASSDSEAVVLPSVGNVIATPGEVVSSL